MNEVSAAEKQQLINRIEGISKFFESNVSDNIKNYIFGDTKVARYVKRIPDYVVYINNILSLAFVFAHGCLRCDNDSEEPVNKKASKQSSLRIINSLNKAYTQYPVTHELIQFVLSDIQFEMLQGTDSELYEVFENLCAFRSKDFSLTKYYKLIATWKAAPSRFNMNSNELAGMFQNLLKNMTFLANYELVIEDGNVFFRDKESEQFGDYGKYSYVPAQHLIYFDPEKYLDMYTLYSIEKLEDNGERRLGMRYVTGDGYKTISFTVAENEPDDESQKEFFIEGEAEDFYYEIVGEDWNYEGDEQSVKKNSNFIDQVHAINYKYIKNLALSISDAISVNMGSKKALFDAYNLRHRDLFDKVPQAADVESLKLDWDGIIVMLLIESSPTSVLETLFRAVPQTFLTVARNLCKRIDNPDMPIWGLTDYELDAKVKEIIKTKFILGETGAFGKIPRGRATQRHYASAASFLIVSSLSAAVEEENVEKSICAGNIYDNISLLEKLKSDVDAEQRAKYVCIILGETFRHLLCFYKGILEYGAEKAIFDAESCTSCFSEQRIATYQKQMQKAFMDAAREEANSLKAYNSSQHSDMLSLMDRFISFCEECSTSIAAHKLYAALGKHEILNVGEFKAYVRGCVRNLAAIDEGNIDAWISFALDILLYLKTGTFKKTSGAPAQAIYPFAATYSRGNENYDGYKTVTFTLNIDSDGDDRIDKKEYISVLTEFSYNLSNVFYCLPNVLRSNKKWWIDPVLINFKEFNEIFVEDDTE
jgi:hypothetical protein